MSLFSFIDLTRLVRKLIYSEVPDKNVAEETNLNSDNAGFRVPMLQWLEL